MCAACETDRQPYRSRSASGHRSTLDGRCAVRAPKRSCARGAVAQTSPAKEASPPEGGGAGKMKKGQCRTSPASPAHQLAQAWGGFRFGMLSLHLTLLRRYVPPLRSENNYFSTIRLIRPAATGARTSRFQLDRASGNEACTSSPAFTR
jgi:hypothetical protein